MARLARSELCNTSTPGQTGTASVFSPRALPARPSHSISLPCHQYLSLADPTWEVRYHYLFAIGTVQSDHLTVGRWLLVQITMELAEASSLARKAAQVEVQADQRQANRVFLHATPNSAFLNASITSISPPEPPRVSPSSRLSSNPHRGQSRRL